MSGRRHCRVCGCHDLAACMTPQGPCWWVEPDLCSGCLTPSPDRRIRRKGAEVLLFEHGNVVEFVCIESGSARP